jgi:tetratricopeptide (TPR) repeat protein
MVLWHVIQNNRWEQGIYFAITVPNDAIGMFYPYLEMEGMVFRLTPTEAEDDMPRVDVDKMWKNFTELYDLTSVVDENGYADHSIYRDPQTAHLLRNYPATLGRIGWFSAQQGDYERAVEALEWAYRLEPAFPVVASALPIVYLQMGDDDAAMDAARRTLPYQAHPSSAALDFGDALISLKQDSLAAEWGLELMQADPMVPEYVQLRIRALLLDGRVPESREAIEDWVQRTGDTSARQELERMIEQVERARVARDSATAPEGEAP